MALGGDRRPPHPSTNSKSPAHRFGHRDCVDPGSPVAIGDQRDLEETSRAGSCVAMFRPGVSKTGTILAWWVSPPVGEGLAMNNTLNWVLCWV